MITFRVSTELPESHHVELTLPAEIPAGKVDLVVHVMPPCAGRIRRRRLPLAHWTDRHLERWAGKLGSAS
jgi:hypothetical protein